MLERELFYDLGQFSAGHWRFNYVNFCTNLKLVLPIASKKNKSRRTINYGLSKDPSAKALRCD
ncbi:hypothetical protein F3628_16205 [Vibrio cholerae]|nr:hypothetical protein [Vibrio cholerae]TQQ13977.1 hypothetical protein FLL71_01705 [Vibrio cholerae]